MMLRRLFLALPAVALAQSKTVPGGVRQGHVLGYDSRRRELLLFGGLGPPESSGDEPLWILADGSWRRAAGTGPRSRSLPAAVYDPKRGRFVLYGGISNFSETRFGDWWEWDGETWQEMGWRRLGPGPRDHHAMTYDSARERLVVYGGSVIILKESTAGEITTAAEVWYDDVWEFDGEAWKPLATTGPGTRAHHCFAYDPVSQTTLLFGGVSRDQQASPATWGWNGSQWRKLANDGPPPRSHSRMAFHEASGEMVLYGGDGSRVLSDTWTWNGTAWRQRAQLDTPGPRLLHAMAYHADLQRVILYGGNPDAKENDDAWAWDGENWSPLTV